MEILLNFVLGLLIVVLLGWGWASILVPRLQDQWIVAMACGLGILIWAGVWVQFLNVSFSSYHWLVLFFLLLSGSLGVWRLRMTPWNGRPAGWLFCLALAAGATYLMPIWLQDGRGLYTLNGGDVSVYLGISRLLEILKHPSNLWSLESVPPEIGWSFSKAIHARIVQPSLIGGVALWLSARPPWTDSFSWYSSLIAVAYSLAVCGTVLLMRTVFSTAKRSSQVTVGLMMFATNGVFWLAMAHYFAHVVAVGVLGVLSAVGYMVSKQPRISLPALLCFGGLLGTILVYYSPLVLLYGILWTCMIVSYLFISRPPAKELWLHLQKVGLVVGAVLVLCWPAVQPMLRLVKVLAVATATRSVDVAVPFQSAWDYLLAFTGHVGPSSLFPWNQTNATGFAVPQALKDLGLLLGWSLLFLGSTQALRQSAKVRTGFILFGCLAVLAVWSLRGTEYRLMKLGLYLLPFFLILGSQAVDWSSLRLKRIGWCLTGGFILVSALCKVALLSEAIKGSEHSFHFSRYDLELCEALESSPWSRNKPVCLLSYNGFIKMAVMDTAFLEQRYYTGTAYTYKGPYPWEVTERVQDVLPELQLFRREPDILAEPEGDVLFENPQWKVVRLEGAERDKAFLVGPAWNAPLPLASGQQFRWLRNKGLLGLWLAEGGRFRLQISAASEKVRNGSILEISLDGSRFQHVEIRCDPAQYPEFHDLDLELLLEAGSHFLEINPQKLPEDDQPGQPWVMVASIRVVRN
ncbi:MAG: hypothetical protein AB1898_06270 [Acidobacteriota bacterium]